MNRVALFLERLGEPLQSEEGLLRLRTQWLEELQPDEIVDMLTGLARLAQVSRDGGEAEIQTDGGSAEEEPSDSGVGEQRLWVWQRLLPVVMEGLLRAIQRQRSKMLQPPVADVVVAAIADCYGTLAPEREERSTLLEALTLLASPRSLEQFAELVVTRPPRDGMKLDRAFARLFHRPVGGSESLFPRLLDGLSQPGVATAVLDLANYLTREERCSVHPAADRVEELIKLLGGLVSRLEMLEQGGVAGQLDPEQARLQVADGIALGVALCDALGWIGNERAIPTLNQASELAHRRLRVEAFAALARLGDERGKQSLVALAKEPATRLRAVHYARELKLEGQIEAELLTPVALAESEFASWLSEPRQFGIPPQHIELFDQRTLSWPGFNEPVECFLFRFEYQTEEASYANMGLVGPLTHAFLPDLTDLPPLDIYAAFAGWQATHQDIAELSIHTIDPSRRLDYENLEQRLAELGFEQPQWRSLGLFFGEHVFVGQATKAGVSGALALSQFDFAWFPARARGRSIDGELAFSIWKGRRFLKQFNPDETFSVSSEDETE